MINSQEYTQQDEATNLLEIDSSFWQRISTVSSFSQLRALSKHTGKNPVLTKDPNSNSVIILFIKTNKNESFYPTFSVMSFV